MSDHPAKTSFLERIWNSTGFAAYPNEETARQKDAKRGKTLWDFLQVFIIPVAIFAATLSINSVNNQRQAQSDALQRQDTLLQAYIDKVADLVVNEKLGQTGQTPQGAFAAQVQTSAVPSTLDGLHRGRLIQFLDASSLIHFVDPRLDPTVIQRGNPVIKLRNIDLSGADLTGVTLQPNDSMIGVILNGAIFDHANLNGCNLNGAELHGAILTDANLSGVDLSNADLTGADLTGANLVNTVVTQDQLLKAKSLAGAITATPTVQPTMTPVPTS